MRNLLFLTHRLPYPPNKGDKVRSYHLLKALAREHRVFLGTFIDDPADDAHVDAIRPLCAQIHVSHLDPRIAKLRSLTGLVTGEALTFPYYRNRGFAAWVQHVVATCDIETAVVFSSPMAQYVAEIPELRVLVDFVDVDSAKWEEYAASHRWPWSAIYAREGSRLLEAERAIAARSVRSFFVTKAETALFQRLAPECSDKVEPLSNGVDSVYFSPDSDRASPYEAGELPIVFTGAMDYWPNIDAVTWFASDVLPQVLALWPGARFYIVGMRPTPAVQALAGPAVIVTGTVPDVRPYLEHAAAVVAPLRVARGIQNKVLEAMAMGKAVVTSKACASAIDGVTEAELVGAEGATEFTDAVDAILRDRARSHALGEAARRFVQRAYTWDACLSRLAPYLAGPQPGARACAPPADLNSVALP